MENLFSYGTLQLPRVQLELFGRILKLDADTLIGFKKEKIKIKAKSTVNGITEEEHVIISYSGNAVDIIEGAVLSITLFELERADEYETDDYKRISATLQSGRSSWVYVKNDKQ